MVFVLYTTERQAVFASKVLLENHAVSRVLTNVVGMVYAVHIHVVHVTLTGKGMIAVKGHVRMQELGLM